MRRPETIHLIEELTRRTGESAETAVAAALRERLDRLRSAEEKTRREAIYALVNKLNRMDKESQPIEMDHGVLLYGEDGRSKGILMAVQIETPETVRLLEKRSQLAGESTEVTVEIALRERLERLHLSEAETQRRAEVQALVNKIATRFRESDQPAIDHGEWLYGEDGLPR